MSLGVFFLSFIFGKVLKFVHAQFLIFFGGLVPSFLLLKGGQIPLSNSKT